MRPPVPGRMPAKLPGGIPMPPPIMGKTAPPMAKPPGAADPDNDGDGGGVKIDPAAVHYHDDAQSCQTCAHFQGGNCEVLQMQVAPEGACNAYSSGGGEEAGASSGDDGDDVMGGGNSGNGDGADNY